MTAFRSTYRSKEGYGSPKPLILMQRIVTRHFQTQSARTQIHDNALRHGRDRSDPAPLHLEQRANSVLSLSDGEPDGRSAHVTQGIRGFRFSRDGNRVAVVTPSYQVLFYELSTGQILPLRIQLVDLPLHVEYAPDELRILTVTRDGVARVWDVASGSALTGPVTLPWLTWAVCLAPDGQTVIAPDFESRVRFLDVTPVLPPGWPDRRALNTELKRLDEAVGYARQPPNGRRAES